MLDLWKKYLSGFERYGVPESRDEDIVVVLNISNDKSAMSEISLHSLDVCSNLGKFKSAEIC